ncbi:TPA: GIY-YIG nuclease family protein [Serratia marcescens]|uniref:GIY-YIG nuclease family protein n=1 Tax=Serratia TaxID=613 RepID=UPI00217A8DDB|nr:MULTISPECIES: GIY-YIG nuclease family protein [Serratia]MDW5503008.1 GIY-YIG nuclease family protein [Serratia proteamaculans]MDW5508063.1 GIY-YIG nuclease family protein [Pseudomonas lundensis]CAI1213519.1 Uncharacterised protein [Serratia liquefaciens]
MDLFSYLTLALPDLSPERCHVHFASINDYDEDPLTEFEHGTFDEWQCWQKKKVFRRPYVVSLIQTENRLRWMYAGTYETGELPRDAEPVSGRDEAYYRYALQPVTALSEYAGRLHVSRALAANARAFIRRGEAVAPYLAITDISSARRSLGRFPGYREVCIDMRTLGLIHREDNQSWIRTLADVKGIYLLTDEEGGKLYVGKADGADGLWGRWMSYLRTGHGGNVGLIEAFGDLEATRLNQVKFSVLEVMDLNSAQGEIERREAHWKRVLLTRRYGHNRN